MKRHPRKCIYTFDIAHRHPQTCRDPLPWFPGSWLCTWLTLPLKYECQTCPIHKETSHIMRKNTFAGLSKYRSFCRHQHCQHDQNQHHETWGAHPCAQCTTMGWRKYSSTAAARRAERSTPWKEGWYLKGGEDWCLKWLNARDFTQVIENVVCDRVWLSAMSPKKYTCKPLWESVIFIDTWNDTTPLALSRYQNDEFDTDTCLNISMPILKRYHGKNLKHQEK